MKIPKLPQSKTHQPRSTAYTRSELRLRHGLAKGGKAFDESLSFRLERHVLGRWFGEMSSRPYTSSAQSNATRGAQRDDLGTSKMSRPRLTIILSFVMDGRLLWVQQS